MKDLKQLTQDLFEAYKENEETSLIVVSSIPFSDTKMESVVAVKGRSINAMMALRNAIESNNSMREVAIAAVGSYFANQSEKISSDDADSELKKTIFKAVSMGIMRLIEIENKEARLEEAK